MTAIPNTAFEKAAYSLSATRDAQPGAVRDRKTAEDFEAFFLSQMFSQMYAGIETDPLFGGGPGEDVFRTMMIDQYGRSVARSGGVGIADAVMREMVRMQEAN